MVPEDQFTPIIKRLSEIETVLKQCVEAINEASRRHDLQQHEPVAVNAVIRQPEAIEREQATRQNNAQRTQNVIAIAAWFAFIAALAYAVIAQITLGQIREQTAQIYHQSDVENATASRRTAETFQQLAIAQKQANAAQDSVSIIQKQFRLDQRPQIWLASGKDLPPQRNIIDAVPVTREGKKEIAVNVYFTNYGKSPANLAWGRRGIGIGQNAPTKIKMSDVISQNGVMPSGVTNLLSLYSEVMTDKEITDALNLDKGIAVRIQFNYQDSLGFTYETDICNMRFSNSVWGDCPPNTGPNGIKDCSEERCDKKWK